MFRLMGPVQDSHKNLFFKFQSSKFVVAIEAAWPETKWIYLFRDPLEVMASNLKVCGGTCAPTDLLSVRAFGASVSLPALGRDVAHLCHF